MEALGCVDPLPGTQIELAGSRLKGSDANELNGRKKLRCLYQQNSREPTFYSNVKVNSLSICMSIYLSQDHCNCINTL